MKQTIDWHQYWTRESPGFHEGRLNQYLERFLPQFELQPSDSIFLPLCGKAYDIYWLWQQGLEVVGVELSQVAVESFMSEFNVDYQLQRDGKLNVYSAPGLTLYQGDLLDLEARHLQACKLVYDRASLVAIESFNRSSYVAVMQKLLPQATPMLLITLDYDQALMSGPPFSVPVAEVEALYGSNYRVEVLLSREQIDERPKWREMGLKTFKEIALRFHPLQNSSG